MNPLIVASFLLVTVSAALANPYAAHGHGHGAVATSYTAVKQIHPVAHHAPAHYGHGGPAHLTYAPAHAPLAYAKPAAAIVAPAYGYGHFPVAHAAPVAAVAKVAHTAHYAAPLAQHGYGHGLEHGFAGHGYGHGLGHGLYGGHGAPLAGPYGGHGYGGHGYGGHGYGGHGYAGHGYAAPLALGHYGGPYGGGHGHYGGGLGHYGGGLGHYGAGLGHYGGPGYGHGFHAGAAKAAAAKAA